MANRHATCYNFPIMDEPTSTQSVKQILTLPVAILVAGLVIGGAIIYTKGSPEVVADQPATVGDTRNYGPQNMKPVDESDHIIGNPNAAVKIVEYSDLECPYCKEFHPLLHKIIEDYGKQGDVAWIYRHFPLLSKHPKALAEAHASECAAEIGGDGAFWKYIDKVFEVSPTNNGLDLALLPKIAETLGLDVEAWTKCQDSNKFRPLIEAQLNDGIQSGITGTPTSFIISKSGKVYPLGGWINYDALKQIIELAIADKL